MVHSGAAGISPGSHAGEVLVCIRLGTSLIIGVIVLTSLVYCSH